MVTSHVNTITLPVCINSTLPLSDTLRDADKLLYDVTWGGMISRGVDDSEDIDPNANFGFVTYNDHHFHLGYWVYAMAYYVQYYPQWGIGEPVPK